MVWQNVWYLWLLALVPLLGGLLWWYGKRQREQRGAFFGDDLFADLLQGQWLRGQRLQLGALFMGLCFLIAGVAGPKIGTQVKEVKRQGVDLLVALDLSASMNAEDVKPSRLEKAKYEISRLVDRLQGDRVGLIIFTGDAYLQAPLTLDYSAMRLFLNIAETTQMPNSATDFSAAMQTAARAFESREQEASTQASKVLLIISDGENHGNDYAEALAGLRDENIGVYTLGIGSRSGGTIPVYKNGTVTGYKRDDSGAIVTTKLVPDVLQTIAADGNGSYYEIEGGSDGIDEFLARLDELQQGEFSSEQYADFKNQYQWLAGIGLGFVVVGLLVPVYRVTK